MELNEKLELAKRLVHEFVDRTGVSGQDPSGERYLWTDAFAVQCLWGLYREMEEEKYRDWALQLISLVHENLGKFRRDDVREGWISGKSEKEGADHPTAGGLRIGKKMSERKAGETYNARLEWERDGQYFHYNTRWIAALLATHRETGDQKYARYASELALTSGNFIDRESGRKRMYWKMSTDLSRPLVDNMGAHDPLEGAIMARLCKEVYPDLESELNEVIGELEIICTGRTWGTSDPLGIGGLMLNVVRANSLDNEDLPKELQAGFLTEATLEGLVSFDKKYDPKQPAYQRLAFRECGMTMGFRILSSVKSGEIDGLKIIKEFENLISHLENFWSKKESRNAASWLDHLDINSISLASSLLANNQAEAFVKIR